MFFLLHRHADDGSILQFSKDFRPLSEDFQILFGRSDEYFQAFSKHFQKIAEDD